MRRILFSWRGVKVRSYPALLYVGLLLGVVAGNSAAHAGGIDPLHTFVASLLLIVPASVGARLLYVATHWPLYQGNWRLAWRRREGGASSYGALLLALPASWPVTKLLGLPFARFLDVVTFSVLVAMIAIRLGCFLNGCCAGRVSTAWCTLHLPNHRGIWGKRFPTQLLEALWAAGLLASACVVWRALPFPGALLLVAIGAYATGKMLLEPLRERPPKASQMRAWVSAALIIVTAGASIALWLASG